MGGAPYQLNLHSEDCYGYLDQKHVCTFETMHIQRNSLHIEHFAIVTDVIGHKLGQQILRAFARLVDEQNPSLGYMSFSLHRSTSATKRSQESLLKLAEARKQLLEEIGAVDIEINRPNSECYDVTAKWYKAMWLEETKDST
mgnify:FL=1